MIGKTVSHYKIIEQLGAGGMGVVYKAEDIKLKRIVALKFLPPELTRDAEAKERFIREAQAASVLEHPNICNIHEIDETDDGQLFIVMACYGGETLKQKLANGSLPIDQAVDIANQIAQGLEKAHEKGIVHRDIKPANILITNDGIVKILDFGLAKLSGQIKLTKTGTTLGTVAYMSPEQAKGDEVDYQTDIWSLGVILYEMLTGQLPFKGDYEQAVVYAILNEESAPLKSLRNEISIELDQIVMRTLEKDKGSRYVSVKKLCKDLIQHRSTLLLPVSGSLDSKPKIRKKLRPKIVIYSILFLTIIGFTLFTIVNKKIKIRWAKERAIPEIIQLIEDRNFISAFHLAQRVERVIPDDSILTELWPRMSRFVTIQTAPSGSDVYMKEYNDVANAWKYLGKTPIDSNRIPRGFFRWKIEKEGYNSYEDANPGDGGSYRYTLDKTGSIPEGMVRISGGEHTILLIGQGYQTVPLGDYLIDKYEVSNNQYEKFVNSGGYQNKEFWKYQFIKGKKEISWKEAMAEFRDATGRPGPATWELGSYPEGHSDHPVRGVSWYEAAAYAEFAGKKLPTYFHWNITAATDYSEYIIPKSNFKDNGSVPVGSSSGLNYFGTYDMAGNVREWCYNAVGEKRFILGGAWDDPYYMFYIRDAKNPFDRSPGNGFRCVKYLSLESSSEMIERPIAISVRDYSVEKPVSEEIFKIYTSLYSYDKTDLNPEIEYVDKQSKDWKMQRISYNTAYDNERMSAYLFLPRNARPPYQTVLIFPGAGVFRKQSSENGSNLHSWYAIDFVIKSGRAVLYPVYKSTYERFDNYNYWQSNLHGYRDNVILWSKDLSRSIDYLETRADIDQEKLCFAGSSWGSAIAPMLLALETRIKVCYLFSGGLWFYKPLREVDQLNFISHVKIPVLMLNGRYDDLFPYETLQLPMYRLFGAADEHKRHRLFDVGHSVPKPRNEYIREVLDWLDRYLGPVKLRGSY